MYSVKISHLRLAPNFKYFFFATVAALYFFSLTNAFTGYTQQNYYVYLLSATLLGIAAANILSLTSSLVITANNRWVLASVVALPLLFPLLFLGIGSLQFAFGESTQQSGWQAISALVAYAVIPLGLGPTLAESLWRERRDPSQSTDAKQNKGGK